MDHISYRFWCNFTCKGNLTCATSSLPKGTISDTSSSLRLKMNQKLDQFWTWRPILTSKLLPVLILYDHSYTKQYYDILISSGKLNYQACGSWYEILSQQLRWKASAELRKSRRSQPGESTDKCSVYNENFGNVMVLLLAPWGEHLSLFFPLIIFSSPSLLLPHKILLVIWVNSLVDCIMPLNILCWTSGMRRVSIKLLVKY